MSSAKIMIIEPGLNPSSPSLVLLSSALVISHWDWQSLIQGIKIKIALFCICFNMTFNMGTLLQNGRKS